MMKLTPETITILQNYASINQNMILIPGSEIRTIHHTKAVFSTSTIEETIERDAAIADLPRFLRTVGLLNDPAIDFGEKQFVLTDAGGKTTINYTYSDPTAMLRVPSNVRDTAPDAKIRISAETLRSIVTASKSLKLTNLRLSGSTDGTCTAELYDGDGASRDVWKVDLSESAEAIAVNFTKVLKTEYINFVPGSYVAEISNLFVKFSGERTRYWVAVEAGKQ